MSIEIIRKCDICGKVVTRQYAHVDVHYDDRTLAYYTGPNNFDLCQECWKKGWEASLDEAEKGNSDGMDI